MSNYEYIADCYDPFDLELKHWKYIKKYKHNGKWVYIYDESELRRAEEGVTTSSTVDGNTFKSTYSNRKGLFDRTSSNLSGNTYTHKKEVGAISRAIGKAERKVYDTVYKKNSVGRQTLDRVTKKAKKGKSYVDRIFNR